MSSLIRNNPREGKVFEVIDLTGSEDSEMITCDDLHPPALDGKTEYRVEQILECWQPDEEVNECQYLVKWFGYPKSEATWEWESKLSGCDRAILDFHARKYNTLFLY